MPIRLLLLPISTRRNLIYGQRLKAVTTENQSWLDKGTTRAANLWASWEKKESGWQRKVVDYGNQALKRIPYEEWGLKSIPPLSSRVQEAASAGKENVEVLFPDILIPKDNVLNVLKTLGTERQALHKQKLRWSIVGMPLVAPFALIPVIPNLPFFYLVFRAWSHWRALAGSKHIQFLLDKNLVAAQSSPTLNELYKSGKRPFDSNSSKDATETIVLHTSDGKRIAEALGIPELSIELDRAVWQVEKALQAEKERKEEKSKLDAANAESKDK